MINNTSSAAEKGLVYETRKLGVSNKLNVQGSIGQGRIS